MPCRSGLVIERCPVLSGSLRKALEKRSWVVQAVTSCELADRIPNCRAPSLTVVGPGSEACDGIERGKKRQSRWTQAPILFIAARSSESEAIRALRLGVRDYLKHPVGSKEFVLAVERCMQSSDDGSPRCGVEAKPAQNGERSRLIGCSQPMVELREQIENAARCSSTVLITGETGTGKQLVAESVHQQSVRRSRPLVSINCAAIPDSLLESELFGFEKGAFTGAHERREGKLRQAHGGTILLDEIGDMSLSAQAKLLGFLEDRRVCCLGGSSAVLTDVRVVAATNQDLEEAVLRQAFRRDLFYRLNVVRIRIPPLRERREDLPLLIDHLLQEFSKKFGRTVRAFGSDSTDLVMRHDWPGNVRELRNLIEAVFVNRPPAVVTAADLPRHVLNSFERRDSAGRGDRTRCADQGPGGDELE